MRGTTRLEPMGGTKVGGWPVEKFGLGWEAMEECSYLLSYLILTRLVMFLPSFSNFPSAILPPLFQHQHNISTAPSTMASHTDTPDTTKAFVPLGTPLPSPAPQPTNIHQKTTPK
jgi:hypothetical protein